MIEAVHLTKEFGAIRAVDDASFSVPKGAIAGFLGPNGAGKSTTMKILTGIIPPNRGRALVAGVDVLAEPFRAREKLGYLPENSPCYQDISVLSYLDFVGCLKGLQRAERRAAIDSVVDRCGLGTVTRRLVAKLSKGFRQRVGIAQALLGDPEVLVLDEPTVGLDPEQVREIRELIASLRGEATILLSSHVLSEVSLVCDHVVVIHGGRILAEGSPDDLGERLRSFLRVKIRVTTERDRVVAALTEIPGLDNVRPDENDERGILAEAVDEACLGAITERVHEGGWRLLEIRTDAATLEDVFLSLIHEGDE